MSIYDPLSICDERKSGRVSLIRFDLNGTLDCERILVTLLRGLAPAVAVAKFELGATMAKLDKDRPLAQSDIAIYDPVSYFAMQTK
jgi:hypothetical protein